MYSRDQVNFCGKWTDFFDCTTVRTLVVFEDHLADNLLLVLIYSFTKFGKPLFVISKSFFQLFCDFTDIFFSCLLVICEYCNFHLFRCYDLLNRFKEFFRYCKAYIIMFWFSTFCNDLVDECDDFLIHFMRREDGFEHLSFRYFICSGFNHDYLFSCRCNSQCKVGLFFLLCGWIEYQFSVNKSYLGRSCRTIERDIRNSSCNR